MKILTIDPGDTTGFVEAKIDTTLLRLKPFQGRYTANQFYNVLIKCNPEQVLCEKFECRQHNTLGMSMTSAHLIGVTMLYCEEYDIPLRMQDPSFGEGGFFKGMNNLKKAGVYIGGEPYHHAMEAMRGFMQWFTFGPGYKYHNKQQIELIK